jgi:hypothetical protein
MFYKHRALLGFRKNTAPPGTPGNRPVLLYLLFMTTYTSIAIFSLVTFRVIHLGQALISKWKWRTQQAPHVRVFWGGGTSRTPIALKILANRQTQHFMRTQSIGDN